MTDSLRVGIAGFDITPRFHPRYGAWGTTPSMTDVDLPLLSRCIALECDDTRVLWFGSDLVGGWVGDTDNLRGEIAAALGMQREQILWSTSQTHSSGAMPGSRVTGSLLCEVNGQDVDFVNEERRRLMNRFIEGAWRALESLQPARVSAGHGYCDSMSYNTRLPMPNGGVKFSRHHAEGLQSGKFFDPTIGLVRFDDAQGKPLGAIFNFCCHPATMIDQRWISTDWVGTARQHIEDALGGAPAMFVQGMCGDVNCHHIFGTPAHAKRNGDKLGRAAVQALPFLTPVRSEPLLLSWRTIELPCRPMYSPQELETALVARRAFIAELQEDPTACWFSGINLPESFTVEQKTAFVNVQIEYLLEGLRILQVQEPVHTALPITVGGLRIGDVAAFVSPGENFTATGRDIRQHSPFVHTLICGDTNGLFGYIGDDTEIERGGYETDSYWKMLVVDGFRLALAKGTVRQIKEAAESLWRELADQPNSDQRPLPSPPLRGPKRARPSSAGLTSVNPLTPTPTSRG